MEFKTIESLANFILISFQRDHWSGFSVHLMNISLIFTLLLAVLSSPIPEGSIWLCVHQLVSVSICHLLLGRYYIDLFLAFSLTTTVCCWKWEFKLKVQCKRDSNALWSWGEVWICHYEQHHWHFTLIWPIVKSTDYCSVFFRCCRYLIALAVITVICRGMRVWLRLVV